METVSVFFRLHLWVKVVELGTLSKRFPDGEVCPTLVTIGTLLVPPSYRCVLTGVEVLNVTCPILVSGMPPLSDCRLLMVFVINLLSIDTIVLPYNITEWLERDL